MSALATLKKILSNNSKLRPKVSFGLNFEAKNYSLWQRTRKKQ